jgi:hypothetical protein
VEHVKENKESSWKDIKGRKETACKVGKEVGLIEIREKTTGKERK